MVTPTGDNLKTWKEKAMEQSTFLAKEWSALASLKTTKGTAMATASGKTEIFIMGNRRKEKEKNTDFKSGQMEMNTMDNGNRTREQE
jgi:hypothetical protein